jgi:hypothetical protein
MVLPPERLSPQLLLVVAAALPVAGLGEVVVGGEPGLVVGVD